jgi:hypothetical protein
MMSANPAVDLVLDKNPSVDDFHVVCASETDLKIHPEQEPVEVMVDQARATPIVRQGFISLAHLAKGEHVVRISY